MGFVFGQTRAWKRTKDAKDAEELCRKNKQFAKTQNLQPLKFLAIT